MRLGNKIGLLILLAIPIWILIRAQLIYKEGPEVVKKISEYRGQKNVYPQTLEEVGIKSFLSPRYHLDKEKGQYFLMYSIFVFYRWYYDSEDSRWKTMD